MKIAITKLSDHPLNRLFDQFGEKWEAMVGSVREHGVIQMPLVRPFGEGYQIVCGHRRVAAAQEVEMEELECDVRDMDDRTVLEILVIENLERENPDPVEEGKLLRALEAEGVDVTILAHRLKRSVAWIVTRQRLLDLGDEVLEAVRKPKDEAGHLGMGTVEVILSVPDSERARAIQLVLHPEWTDEVLGMREAENVIKSVILEPARRKALWEKESASLVKAWKKALGTYLTKDQKRDLIVQAVRFEEHETSKLKTCADALIPPDRLRDPADEDAGTRWVHLALFHGLPVWVYPVEMTSDTEESSALVDERLIVMAEAARAENGMVATLLTAKEQTTKTAREHEGQIAKANAKAAKEREERIDKALGELEGTGDPSYEEEEAPERVIEQRLESRAWVDLGPVRKIREEFTTLEWPKDEAPQDAPEWLRKIWEGDYGQEEIVALCDWIIGLQR